ncbi:MAG: filamentous hemagglutinin N-terminal domain-containing protein, partial [Negativicutes bacterium]
MKQSRKIRRSWLREIPQWMRCFCRSVLKAAKTQSRRVVKGFNCLHKNIQTQISQIGDGIRAHTKEWAAAALAAGLFVSPYMVDAAPQDGVVVGGRATITQAGDVTNIAQASQRAAIDWSSFDIAKHETVNFQQPNASAVALNRIVGNNPSAIYGQLNANGIVYLANPNGMYFAPGAQVNVAGLIATTSHVDPLAFMQNGTINTSERNGTINIQGSIFASGGLVEIKGATAINVGGIIKATTLNGNGGAITLNNANNITVSGTLNANAGATGNGGTIEIIADKATGTLAVTGATLLARGGDSVGAGGFIETSGKSVLFGGAMVNAGAANGSAGSWLVDPTDIVIDSTSAAAISLALTSSNVTVATDGEIAGNGDILVNSTIDYAAGTSNHDLTLSAYRDITIVSGQQIQYGGTGTLTLRCDNSGTGVGTFNATDANAVTLGTLATAKVYYNPATFGTATSFNITGGTSIGYMLVNTAANLAAIGNNTSWWGDGFALGNDIDMTGVTYTPIGNAATSFSGKFDGLNNTISNLTINTTNVQYVGLFGYVGSGAIVSSLVLNSPNISASSSNTELCIGGIAGKNLGAINNTILNGGSVTGSSTTGVVYVGGIAGVNAVGSTLVGGTVSGATLSGSNVSDGNVCVGGIAGDNWGLITGGLVSAGLTKAQDFGSDYYSSNLYAGGFVGMNEAGAVVSGVTASGVTVIGDGTGFYYNVYAGGIAGHNYGLITYATGSGITVSSSNITCFAFAGGIAGRNDSTISGVQLSGSTVSATENVLVSDWGQDSFVGGIAGINGDGALITDVAVTGGIMRGALTGSGCPGATVFVGGVVGKDDSNNSHINNVTITGATISAASINSTLSVAGIIGGSDVWRGSRGATVSGVTITGITLDSRTAGGTIRTGGIAGNYYDVLTSASVNGLNISADSSSGKVYAGGSFGIYGGSSFTGADTRTVLTGGNIALDYTGGGSITAGITGTAATINQISEATLTLGASTISVGGLAVTATGAVIINGATTISAGNGTILANNGDLTFTTSGKLAVAGADNLYLAATFGNIINNSTLGATAIEMGSGRYILWSNKKTDTILNGLTPTSASTLGTYTTYPPANAYWTSHNGNYVMYAMASSIVISGSLANLSVLTTYTIDLLSSGSLLGTTTAPGGSNYSINYDGELTSPFMVYVKNFDYGGNAAATFVSGSSYNISKNVLNSNVAAMSDLRTIALNNYSVGNMPFSYTGNNIFLQPGVGLTADSSQFIVDGNITITAAGQTYSGAVTAISAATLAALNSGGINFAGNLTATVAPLNIITTGGAINVDGIINAVGQTLTINTGSGHITATNAANDFSILSLSGGQAAITDINGLTLATSTLTDVTNYFGLTVTANGNITQSGALIVSGKTTLMDSGNTIALDNVSNNFNHLNLTAASAVIRDGNALYLAGADVGSAGSLQITTGGDLTQGTNDGEQILGGAVTLTAAGSIGLESSFNDFNGILCLTAAAARVRQQDNRNLTLGSATITGAGIDNGLAIYASSKTISQAPGTNLDITSWAGFNNPTGTISLLNTGNNFGGTLSVSGYPSDQGPLKVEILAAGPVTLGSCQISGSFLLTAGGNVSQSVSSSLKGGITVSALGFAVDLSRANFIENTVSVTGASANINAGSYGVAIGNMLLGSGNLTLQNYGQISQTGTITAGGITVGNSGSGYGITLNNANIINGTINSNFSGAGNHTFSLKNNSTTAGEVAVRATTGALTSVTLTYSNAGVNLSEISGSNTATTINVRAGGSVSQTAAITAGTATINAGSNLITLTNTGNNISTMGLTGGTASIVDSNGIALAASSLTTLGLTVNGAVTQSGSITADTATLNAGSSSIVLNDASYSNNFTTLGLTGATALVKDINGVTLAGSSLTQLDVTANGDVRQSGALTVSGTTTINNNGSGSSIDLSSYANVLTGAVTYNFAAGGVHDVGLRDSVTNVGLNVGTWASGSTLDTLSLDLNKAIEFGTGSFGSLPLSAVAMTITATGNITQTAPITAGTATFNADGSNINLTGPANSFGAMSFTGDTVGVAVTGPVALTGGIQTSLNITANGAVTQTEALTAGTVTINAGSSAITLDRTTNDFDTVSLTGGTATIYDKDELTFGASNLASLTASATTFNVSDNVTAISGVTLNAFGSNGTAGQITFASGKTITGTTGMASITARPLAATATSLISGYSSIVGTYSLYDSTDLNNVRNDLSANATYNLSAATLDASGIANFVPIGDSSTPFLGKFYGLSNTIINLTINQTAQYVGLFGYVRGSGATIGNLTLSSPSITGSSSSTEVYVGDVAGYNDGGTITGIAVTEGTISASSLNNAVTVGDIVGGGSGTNNLHGHLLNGAVTLQPASNTVLVTGTSASIVQTAGTVFTIGLSTISAGGLTVTATGSVGQSGVLNVTGVTTINAGANTITLDDTSNDFGTVSLTGGTARIYDMNNITLGASNVARLIASATTFNVSDNVTAINGVTLNAFGSSGSAGQITFASGKTIAGATGTATINARPLAATATSLISGYSSLVGTYSLYDSADLNNVHNDLSENAQYYLNNDIDTGLSGFTPIGNDTDSFAGKFYGQSHTLGGLTINGTSLQCIGLFSRISGSNATVSDLTLAAAHVGGSLEYDLYIGGIAGDNQGTITGSTVDGWTIESSGAYTDYRVGGIAGQNGGTIAGSSVSGATIRCSSEEEQVCIGGIAGLNYGMITDVTVNSGTIAGSNTNNQYAAVLIGGIAGDNHGIITAAALSGGAIEGRSTGGAGYVGGIAGKNSGTITTVTVNGGTISGSSTSGTVYVGSVAGGNEGVSGANTRIAVVGGGDVGLNYSSGGTIGVSLTGASASITQVSESTLTLGTSTISAGGLSVTATGLVTQSGALNITGATTINAVGNVITLDNPENDFGTFSTTGATVSVYDKNNITIGTSNIGSLTAGASNIHNFGNTRVVSSVKFNAYGSGGTPGYITHSGPSSTQISSGQATLSARPLADSGWLIASDGIVGTYTVNDYTDLTRVNNEISQYATYAMNADITAIGTFTPIGAGVGTSFMGKFSGGGHTLTGLSIDSTEAYVGMFQQLSSGATVSNLTLSTPSITGSSASGDIYIGGIAGQNDGTITVSVVSGGTISGSGASGSSVYIGGVVGGNGTVAGSLGTVSGVTVTNTTIAAGGSGVSVNLGGIAGYNAAGLISGARVSGGFVGGSATDGTVCVGGVVGMNNDAVTNSTTSSVTLSGSNLSHGSILIGGIAGINAGSITGAFVNGATIIANGTDCFGKGAAVYVGGIAGENDNVIDNVVINGTTISGSNTSIGSVYAGGVAGYDGSPGTYADTHAVIVDGGINIGYKTGSGSAITVALTGTNATITQTSESTLTLGASTVSVGGLTVTATGSVGQNGVLTISGTTIVNAGSGGITLTNTSNNLGTLTATGGTIAVAAGTALAIANINGSGPVSVSDTAGVTINSGGTVISTATASGTTVATLMINVGTTGIFNNLGATDSVQALNGR